LTVPQGVNDIDQSAWPSLLLRVFYMLANLEGKYNSFRFAIETHLKYGYQTQYCVVCLDIL